MPYGILKCDTVTFTDAGVDKSVSISGLVQNPTFSGNVTVTGTLSGVTVTGTTASFTSGNFTNISGGTHTITSGVFAAGSAANPSISFTSDPNTGIYSPGADQVAISTSGSHRLRITAQGDVGIGTTTPDNFANYTVLDVRGTTGGILQTSNGAQKARLYVTGGGGFLGTVSNDPLIINTNDTERLRVTADGKVGLGTSSVSNTAGFGQQLEVAGSLPCITINQNNAGFTTRKYSLGVNGSGDFGLWDNNVSAYRVVVDTSGRVGVGTTSPTGIFEACGSSSYFRPAGAAGTFLQITAGAANGDVTLAASANSGGYPPLVFATGGGEKARIDSSGRLLVGTSSARSNIAQFADPYFQIEGTYQRTISVVNNENNANASGIALSKIRGTGIVSNGDISGLISFGGYDGSTFRETANIQGVVDGTPGANDMPGRLVFSTTADGASSPTERMRITNAGEVTIGMGGGISNTSPGIAFDRSNNTGRIWAVKTATGTKDLLINYHNGTYVGGITYSDTATALVTSSDIRLKKDITQAPSATGVIEAIEIVSHGWKTSDEVVAYGVIAQNLLSVVPEAVRQGDNGEVVEQTWGVDYAKLIPILVKALQESNQRIETLEAKVAALESA